MKYSKLLFPNFLNKCLTLSYDDGVKQDVKFCEILKKYGLKCTFNINSGQFGKTETDGRLTKKQVLSLYNDKDFEVAVHGSQHLDLTQEAKATAIKDVVTDKDTLENLFNRVILGMAYAFGTYNQEVVEILQNCDIKYSRTTISTNTFALPENFLTWHPTCHHRDENLFKLLNEFLNKENSHGSWFNEARLFYLWGHTYEFDDYNEWGIIENFAKEVGGRKDVWFATNQEVYNYITAYKNLQFSVSGSLIYNPTSVDVYLLINGKQIIAKKGETTKI